MCVYIYIKAKQKAKSYTKILVKDLYILSITVVVSYKYPFK